MALIKIGSYEFPPPLVGSYVVETVPVTRVSENAAGKSIGEFIRYRKRIRWSYAKLSAANNAEMTDALKTSIAGTSIVPLTVEYWDSDSSTVMTGQFIPEATAPTLDRFAGTAIYLNVNFELVEQ